MLGPLVNSAVLIVGGVAGAALGRRIPERVRGALPLTCGILSAAIGTSLMNKVHAIPAVALALLIGAVIGELLFLERGLELAIGWAQKRVERTWPNEGGDPRVENFVARYVTPLAQNSTSSVTYLATILLAKSALDLFTAMIFAAELGFAVAFIAVPQILIQSLLYFGAHLLIPLASPTMLADFSAAGGIIMLATGLRICGIKIFPIVNMLPALVLVMPCSALWSQVFG